MTTDVQVVAPDATLRAAAQLMEARGLSALPVCEGGRLLGIVTDRDIMVRGTALGLVPDHARVSEVMTAGTEWCTGELDIDVVVRLMGEAKVRRMPVIDGQRRVVGIVSLGDIATRRPRRDEGWARPASILPAPRESVAAP